MEGDMYGPDIGMGPITGPGILPGERFEASQDKGRLATEWRAGARRGMLSSHRPHLLVPGARQHRHHA